MLPLGVVYASQAGAQGNDPSRPVTMVVPAATGGTTDFAARILAQPLGAALGQSSKIEAE